MGCAVILNSSSPEATNGVEDQNYRLQFLDGIFVNILRTKKTPRRGVYLWLSLIGKWNAVAISNGESRFAVAISNGESTSSTQRNR